MEDEIIKDGKKFKLVPVEDDPEQVLGSFGQSEGQLSGTDEAVEKPVNEPLPDEIPLVSPEIKVKTGKEMMLVTAKRLTEARISKAIEEAGVDNKFNKKFNRNTEFIYGPGVQSGRTDFEEDQ